MVEELDGRNPMKFKPEIVNCTPFPGDALVMHRISTVACCCVCLPMEKTRRSSAILHVVDFQGSEARRREGSIPKPAYSSFGDSAT